VSWSIKVSNFAFRIRAVSSGTIPPVILPAHGPPSRPSSSNNSALPRLCKKSRGFPGVSDLGEEKGPTWCPRCGTSPTKPGRAGNGVVRRVRYLREAHLEIQ
ncbi:hypothetical protein HAX54_024171, partial [Datura stramonium]|nr:hypothetical protein [Datura stramonium]